MLWQAGKGATEVPVSELDAPASLTVVTVNRHTSYSWLLARTGGRWLVAGDWDERHRPVPANVERVADGELAAAAREADAMVSHDLVRDLPRLAVRGLPSGTPVVQVLHGRRSRTVGAGVPALARSAAKRIATSAALPAAARLGVRYVFISRWDRRDWPIEGTVIDHGIDPAAMDEWRGQEARALVVGNQLDRPHFASELLAEVTDRVPVTVVGDNEDPIVSRPAARWEALRAAYAAHRAFLNVTRPPEKGYNLACLEAMATGLPVVALAHPFTPVVDGENGYLVRTAEEMVERAEALLADRDLAARLGRAARETVRRSFGFEDFRASWHGLLTSLTK